MTTGIVPRLNPPTQGDKAATLAWDPFWLGYDLGLKNKPYIYWKSGSQDYDHSRRVQIDHKHPRTYTIDDLTNGATYSFKLVVNQADE